VQLTAADLASIEATLAAIEVVSDRYPVHLQQRVDN